MNEQFFDVRRYNLGRLQNFTLRYLTGEDEMAAAHRAQDATSMLLNENLIAESIVAVNGERLEGPCIEWTAWPSRDRDFVRSAFNRMNRLTLQERDRFVGENTPPVGADTWALDLGAYGVDIKTITVRTVSGHAEIAADEKSRGKGPVWFTNLLVCESLTEADGRPVTEAIWNGWTMRTRQLVKLAFELFNSARQEDLDDFLDQAFGGSGGGEST